MPSMANATKSDMYILEKFYLYETRAVRVLLFLSFDFGTLLVAVVIKELHYVVAEVLSCWKRQKQAALASAEN